MDENRIAGLATEIVNLYPDRLEEKQRNTESLADDMLALNVDAYRQRYGIQTLFEDNAIDLNRRNWKPLNTSNPVQFFKSLQCFLYQCSEGNVPDKPLFKTLEALVGFLAPGVNQNSRAYNAAVWG
jgi:hypothetical protein